MNRGCRTEISVLPSLWQMPTLAHGIIARSCRPADHSACETAGMQDFTSRISPLLILLSPRYSHLFPSALDLMSAAIASGVLDVALKGNMAEYSHRVPCCFHPPAVVGSEARTVEPAMTHRGNGAVTRKVEGNAENFTKY